ncbi:tetratricopeptide repeat protein [Aurantibacillus circumpalustris]|uniref:tetratricopeptide repeat protein n=1 Tax=Aurantibacillus circumpalustris TaxID=3036359 RepID=UPI00295C070D|nr:tetratricopeptide repeat protein [Aurantibacillus circumpalustris]
MYKTKTNILFALALFFSFAAVFSCKSKKNTSANKIPNPKEENISKELSYASMGYLYVEACLQRKKGNLQEALKLFEECKKIEPKDPAIYYEAGTIYKLLGSDQKALENAKFCATANPNNEWYQLLLVDCYNAIKQYSQAVKIREALVKKFPTKNEFKEDLAIEYAILGYYDKSYKIYDELETTYGINEQITLNKVKLLKSQKKNNEAETELKKLSDLNPSEVRFYGYLAEFYLEQNDLDKAKNMYDKILSVEPNNPEIHLALHNYYSAKGEDALAYENLKKAFLNPDLDIETKTSILGSFYVRAENREKVAFERGVELSVIMLEVHPKSTEANALYADFLMLDNKIKEASVHYYSGAIGERRDFRVWDNLLFADYQLHQFDSLEHHSAKAIEIFPSLPSNYKYNGIANTELKEYKKAVQVLKDGMEFVSDNSQRIEFLSLLGDANFYLKDYEKSDNNFEEALKIEADNTYVLNNYAYYLSLRKEFLDKAEKFSKRANDLQPNNRSYLDTYGWILFQQKKFGEAEQYLSKAASMGPKNPTILEHYGDVLYKLNKITEALKQWDAAKQNGGNSESLINKIKAKKLND